MVPFGFLNLPISHSSPEDKRDIDYGHAVVLMMAADPATSGVSVVLGHPTVSMNVVDKPHQYSHNCRC